MAVLLASPDAARAEPPEFWVDPTIGADAEDAGGGAKPFQTIAYALARAVEAVSAPGYEGPKGVTLYFLNSAFRSPDESGRERFPVVIPPTLESCTIASYSQTRRAQFFSSASYVPFFEVSGQDAEKPFAFTMRNLDFEGAYGAVSVPGFSGRELSLAVEGCTFTECRGRGVDVHMGTGRQGRVSVSGCTFIGGKGGILAMSLPSSRVDLVVEGCEFRELDRYAAYQVLGAAVDLHVDRACTVTAIVSRNVFEGVASAVQVTEADHIDAGEPAGGTLLFRMTNNLVKGAAGLASTDRKSVRNGMYLQLWPHHSSDVLIANNTFAEVLGNVVYEDNLEALDSRSAEEPWNAPAWSFINNVCWSSSPQVEFAAEAFAGAAGKPFPSASAIIRSNILRRSKLGEDGIDGNLSADPALDAAAGHRPAPGSPAIDRGDPSVADVGDLDLAGRCRRSAPTCSGGEGGAYPIDIGAYELPAGFCRVDVTAFARGDCNMDREFELSDAVFLFAFLFMGGRVPPCADACDANDDGELNISDGIFTLSYLFLGARDFPPPYPQAGSDPTRDCLASCERS